MKDKYIISAIVILALALAFGAVGIFFLFMALILSYAAYITHRQIDINLKMQESEIMNAETDAKFRTATCQHGILALWKDNIQFFTREAAAPISSAIAKSELSGVQEDENSKKETKPVLPIIINAPCVLLWGGRGRGKTNLARFVLDQRAKQEDVLIIDPKETAPETWPGFRIAGTDHNYNEIISALEWVNGLHRHRITILIDEMTILKMRIPNFSRHWLKPLIEGRERGQSIWIIGQSKTAGSLGLSGMYDILDSFDFVVGCFYKKSTGERWAIVEESGEPKRICSQPGKYYGVMSGDGDTFTRHRSDTAHTERHPNPTPYGYIDISPVSASDTDTEYDTVLTLWDTGENISRIAEKVFGHKSGRNNAKVKEILQNAGRIQGNE